MGLGSLTSTPEGPFDRNNNPFWYFDACSELDDFLETLLTFSYPIRNSDLQCLEENTFRDEASLIMIPDDAILGQENPCPISKSDSPLKSELLEVPITPFMVITAPNKISHVQTPVGNLRVEKDHMTRTIRIRSLSPTRMLQDMMGKKTKVY